MTIDYADFLDRKTHLASANGFEPTSIPGWLYPFQRMLVEWAIRQGRAALFADCGMGKTPMQLAWADNVRQHTGRPILIVTPLAVSFQTEGEAHKFGYDAAISRSGRVAAAITLTNYERLHLFNPEDYGGVVCDESSAIKAFDGTRRALVTDFLRKHRYRLLCTATAAPNDYIELGTSSEALGYLGYMDMLSRFFTNDRNNSVGGQYHGQQPQWRFKGHAEVPFWRWVASWARALRRPSDLGFSDDGFILPELEQRQHVVIARNPAPGKLFDLPAANLQEEREEMRRTLRERCEQAATLLEHAPVAVAWCQLNDESALLTRLIPGAAEVTGSDSVESKEETLAAFGQREIRVLVSKPSITAWGLNWQFCNQMTFFPNHSYEQFYQAVRRCWRFGQKHPVIVDVVTTEGGENALKSLQRKSLQADRMFDALVAHMRDAAGIRRSDDHTQRLAVPAWL